MVILKTMVVPMIKLFIHSKPSAWSLFYYKQEITSLTSEPKRATMDDSQENKNLKDSAPVLII